MKNIDSTLKLGLLPMKEHRAWHFLKAAHRAIYSHDWPRNLQLEQVKHARNLWSSSTIYLVIEDTWILFSIAWQPSSILYHPMLNAVIILNPSVSKHYVF